MRIVRSLVNRTEELAFNELEKIASDNALRIFPKMRLSDVIEKSGTILSEREFRYFTRSHFDFVIATPDFKPLMGVEYDGPMHADAKQVERDLIKNDLCKRAGFGLLRIHSKHVTRLYRGMTLLRWIVEVYELQRWFDQAQQDGQVPYEEDFDPCFIASDGRGRNFPYWLSAPATQEIHKFIEKIEKGTPKGWFSLSGKDDDDKICKLSYLYVEDKVISSFTAVRMQDVSVPWYTLCDEINTCELGLRLAGFERREFNPLSAKDFRRVFDDFCHRYGATPSHSMGNHPFPASWNGRDWTVS